MHKNFIKVKGANENNLNNINVKIPKDKLIVFTGVSGSGKSSLAFNTIYEEGRRRYVDSLSSYARQFLGNSKKPDVESIEGLSPAISIEQKTTHSNPRSTVGTVTEIYDYLRLLYARIGRPFCPKHKKEISAQRTQDILNSIYNMKENTNLMIASPIIKNQVGSFLFILDELKNDGFVRIYLNGEVKRIDETLKLSKTKKQSISVIVDRINLKKENYSRIADAVEIALNQSNGTVEVIAEEEITSFSRNFSCPEGDFNMPKMEPKLFSFNSPSGMCDDCKGLGQMLKVNTDLLIPNKRAAISEGGIIYYANFIESENVEWQQFEALMNYYNINTGVPIEHLNKEQMNIILYGSKKPIQYNIKTKNGNIFKKNDYIEGVAQLIERRYIETTSNANRSYYKQYMTEIKCPTCKGARLNKFAQSVIIDGINIQEFTKLPIDKEYEKILNIKISKEEEKVSKLIINELFERLGFLINVGIPYISLDRKAETLSGGESQRIRLATQIGSNLTGVLYVLDEPSIGLHQVDNDKLIDTLKKMVNLGNTLIVVEHDEDTIWEADYVIDIGPKAGSEGGDVIATGTPKEISDNPNSITGRFLSGKDKIEIPKIRRRGNNKFIEIIGITENNLKNITVKFPLGKLVVVTGVSGSGKSTLVNQVLSNELTRRLGDSQIKVGKHKEIKGFGNIDKIIRVTQSPIGRTPRSNPATYTSIWDEIRNLYTLSPEARERGYQKGRFSFNVPGGRCDKCKGDGSIKVEMHFLPDVYIECNHCSGQRFNKETLEIKFKGKTIANILDMTVSEAYDFFKEFKKIKDKIEILIEVGLNYIKLGQPATTLSGGEAQRIKLATYLQKKSTGKTLFVLDEPTTGLHSFDIKNLLKVLNKIIDNGDSVILIEHNLDVIKTADHIIDLGPGGGFNGGTVIATGTPEQISKNSKSLTGKYLIKKLNQV
ncbi:MAG: excinuclease ABC subunit UvrA [Mycoplasma sp.]|nr:excinuclease ABC subunit UvrA [Mycoplasma sp.]